MHDQIVKTLHNIEKERDCRILYACESGSRAWGFASPDSDYDVRFIYSHPLAWYLRVDSPDDTFDRMLPNDLDVSGWELRKTLRLFATCNLGLNEWLGSPKVYLTTPFHQELSRLIPLYFKPKKAMFHYLRMAEKTAGQYLDTEAILNRQVNVKKLFYILRPIFASQWIVSKRTMPPTEYDRLLQARSEWDMDFMSDRIYDEVAKIREAKNSLGEKDRVDISQQLINWLQDAMAKIAALAEETSGGGSKDYGPLNELLQRSLDGAFISD